MSSKKKLHALPGQLFQCSDTLNIKNCFIMVEVEFLVVYFMSISAHPVAGHHWKEPGTIL